MKEYLIKEYSDNAYKNHRIVKKYFEGDSIGLNFFCDRDGLRVRSLIEPAELDNKIINSSVSVYAEGEFFINLSLEKNGGNSCAPDEDALTFCVSKLEKCGMSVSQVRAKVCNDKFPDLNGKKRPRRCALVTGNYSVNDTELFLKSIRSGIGRKKYLGCGYFHIISGSGKVIG